MEVSSQKGIRDLNAVIRDLRGVRMIVAHNQFENEDHAVRQTLTFVEEVINHLSMLKLKD